MLAGSVPPAGVGAGLRIPRKVRRQLPQEFGVRDRRPAVSLVRPSVAERTPVGGVIGGL